MLLSLHKRVTVVLCPTQIALRITARGWRPASSDVHVLSCAPSTPAWQNALQLLRMGLVQAGCRGARVQVILADSLLDYALIPWANQLHRQKEVETLMQIHFDAMFGAVTGGREIVADLAQFNAAGIACAIDFGLLDSLRELLHEVHCQLESLQPYFMCVFNRWLTRIVADSATEFMLIVAGENHAVVACRKQGAWLALRSVRYTDPSQLPILIGRERLLQGMNDNTRVYLHSPQPMPEVGLNTFATVLETPAPLPLREMAANMMLCGGD